MKTDHALRERIRTIAESVLMIFGAVSLVGVVVFGVIFSRAMHGFGSGEAAKTDSASTQDVRFVLNWCELGDKRIEKVLHSYVSDRSFTGDYLDAYAIKITHVDVVELTKGGDKFGGRWYRGDQLPEVLGEAVDFVGGTQYKLPWFPTGEQLRSSEIYVFPWTIDCHGVHPTGVELIFLRPSDKMVFYFGSKT